MPHFDFVLISSKAETVGRAERLCEDFKFSHGRATSVDTFVEREAEFEYPLMVLLDLTDLGTSSEAAGAVQVVRQFKTDCHITVIAGRKIPAEEASFIKKSGASQVILEGELPGSSKLEYVASQIIRSSFVPVKVSELLLGSIVDFQIYALLPLNRKFVPIASPGVTLEESRLRKMESVGEVYVRREDLGKYQKYVETHVDQSAAGLKSRCRVQFLNFTSVYMQLVLLLTDQSENASYQAGKALYEKLSELAGDLILSLGAVGEAWDVVNNSAVGDFGSIDRAPAIAAYAGLFSLLSGVGEPKEIMIGALLADVGIIELPVEVTQKLRNGKTAGLTSEEKKQYENHPLVSINCALARKLPIAEEMRKIILCTHEQFDHKGFPGKTLPEKIPFEAFVIQLAELLDGRCLIRMGQARVDFVATRRDIYFEILNSHTRFSPAFMEKMKPVLIS